VDLEDSKDSEDLVPNDIINAQNNETLEKNEEDTSDFIPEDA
jgi:hypothetical protein